MKVILELVHETKQLTGVGTEMNIKEILSAFATILSSTFPPSVSRKRIGVNFLYYSIASIRYSGVSKIKYVPDFPAAGTGSDIWDAFSRCISLYTIFFRKKYLLNGYLIRKVAGGYADPKFYGVDNPKLTIEMILGISSVRLEAVDSVSRSISSRFAGVKYLTIRNWLQTYQFSLGELDLEREHIENILKDCLVVELGAGIGANAAVHACISRQGVLIYDLAAMLQVQQAVIGEVGKDLNFPSVEYCSDIDDLFRKIGGKKYIVISYWAFTEFPLKLRKKFDGLFQKAQFSLFSCSPKFEGVDNIQYLKETCDRLVGKEMNVHPIKWRPNSSHKYVTFR